MPAFDPFWLLAADHYEKLLPFMPGYNPALQGAEAYELFCKTPLVGLETLPEYDAARMKCRHYIFRKNGLQVFETTTHVHRETQVTIL